MALVFIFGRPGGGKTYKAVADYILPALAQGRRVVHNIAKLRPGEKYTDAGLVVPFNIAPIFPKIGLGEDGDFVFTEPTATDLARYGQFGAAASRSETAWAHVCGGDLVVLDEFFLILSQTAPKTNVAGRGLVRSTNYWLEDFSQFLRAHRHLVGDVRGKPVTTDVIILSQTETDIPNSIKGVGEKTHICKTSVLLGGKRLRVYDFDGYRDASTSQRMAVANHTFKPRKFVYDTYASYTGAAAAKEGLRGFSVIWLFRKVIIYGVVFIVIAIYGFLHFLGFLERAVIPGVTERPEVVRKLQADDTPRRFCGVAFDRECRHYFEELR